MEFIKKLFIGRINRRNFLAGLICSAIFSFSLLIIGTWLNQYGLFYYITIIFLIIAVFSLYCRRFHDLGHSGWYSLIGYIPYVGIILLLYLFLGEGNKGANKYGSKLPISWNFPQQLLSI